MSLDIHFDVVLMLTWSDWATEPRSNRYHYATRFARHLPVFFVQNMRSEKGRIVVTESEIPNLRIVDVSAPILKSQAKELRTLIRAHGFKRPLIWIYDPVHYWQMLDELPNCFRVYHATEDYFLLEFRTHDEHLVIREQLKKLLREIDLVVAVTEGVLKNITKQGGYDGTSIVSENGCDYPFFERLKNEIDEVPAYEKLVAIYQGGVNNRLDYDMLQAIARKMPDVEFRFFGKVVDSEGVQRLRSLNNVHLFGMASPETIGKEMLKATVGIVPFCQDELMQTSLPLKVFEYIACGLPVVSIPINALEKYRHEDNIIRFATTDDEFVVAIRMLAAVRHEPERIARGEQLAWINSYDARFEGVVAAILDNADALHHKTAPLNVALLYDPASCHVGTIREHIDAFRRHSRHSYTLIPAVNPGGEHSTISGLGPIDLSLFDAVVVHYCVRLSLHFHLADDVANALEQFSGLKLLFIQDEYDSVECTRRWMDRLEFDLVYTCIPLDEREKVYPSSRFTATEFLPTLTGYVPESADMDHFIQPLGNRKQVFVYRGRELPPIYGKLGHEKYIIGVEVRRRAQTMDLQVDIACDENSRIYGDDWYRFLASGRATLGTESGANVFDFDGSLVAEIEYLKKRNPAMTFEEVWERSVKPHDGHVRMNQISPKIFEAIRLRTALVLFEGEYSGVIKPDVHYIPLKKDFSNFEDVVAKVMDDNLIHEMTERAFNDVIASGMYSYRNFVAGIDKDMQERCLRRRKRKLMYGAVYVIDDNGHAHQCLPVVPLDLPCAENMLDSRESLKKLNEVFAPAFRPTTIFGAVTAVLSNLMDTPRHIMLRTGISVVRALHKALSRQPVAKQGAQWLYQRLPTRIFVLLRKGINGG